MRLIITYNDNYREKQEILIEIDDDKLIEEIRKAVSEKFKILISSFLLTVKKHGQAVLMTDSWPINFFAEENSVIKVIPISSLKLSDSQYTCDTLPSNLNSKFETLTFIDLEMAISACRKPNFDYFKHIVDKNQDPKFMHSTQACNWGFLHYACLSGCHKIVEYLVKNHVDCNLTTIDEWTPIQLCCFFNNILCLKELLKSPSININQKTKFRGTALHIACKNNNIKCIEFLLQQNPDPFQEDHEEKIPIELISSPEVFDILAAYMRKIDDPKNLSENLTNYFGQVFIKKTVFITKKPVFLSLDTKWGDIKCFVSKDDYLDLKRPMFTIYLIEILNISIDYKRKKEYYFYIKTECKKYSFMTELEESTLEWADRIRSAMAIFRYKNKNSIADLNLSSYYNSIYPNREEIDLDDLTILGELGHGSFGTVFKVQKKTTGEYCALKCLKKKLLKKQKHLKYAINEFNIMKKLNHPFIAKLLNSFETEESMFLVIELCYGDLYSILNEKKVLNEKTVKIYAAELVLATEYLHKKGILYRDFKPQNVLISDDFHIKLADFGLAKENLKTPAMTIAGTPVYLPPEIVKKKGSTFKSDIYGLGAIIYEMFTGFPAFFSDSMASLFNKITKNKLYFPDSVPEPAKDLIKSMMNRNPGKRPLISQIKRHIFFNKTDWEALPKKFTNLNKDIL